MTECKTHSSLFALVDSHLSKISLQESKSNDDVECSGFGSVAGRSNDVVTQSKLFTPDRILPLPKLNLSESPISSVLANQVANMLLAKEKRQEEERKKSLKEDDTEEDDHDDDNFVIDLSQALQIPGTLRFQNYTDTVLSSSSSCESLFKLQLMDYEEDTYTEQTKSPEPLLPCVTDMSYILSEKVYRAKCSSFGKVLTSRIRPAASWYMPEKCDGHNIKRFSFNIPSPCDLIKEKLRRPTMSCNQVSNNILNE